MEGKRRRRWVWVKTLPDKKEKAKVVDRSTSKEMANKRIIITKEQERPFDFDLFSTFRQALYEIKPRKLDFSATFSIQLY